ncbi:hypothetical protein bcere0022_10060 [Bacillus cereus Rock3-44]|nr:hypothetical protein bcere0022_10060 [Bacillus cereus Rock3-44]
MYHFLPCHMKTEGESIELDFFSVQKVTCRKNVKISMIFGFYSL